VQFLAQKHLLIPFLGLLAAAFLVLASSSGILGVVVAITVLVGAIAYLVKHWGAVWAGIKDVTVAAWHWLYDNVFAKLITFFTKTIPAVLDIMKESVRILWDDIKILFLKGVYAITGIMAKLPGPLGAPFRQAHKDIGNELAGIEKDVAKAAANINADWGRIHGKVVPVTWRLSLPSGLPGIRAGGAPTRTAATGMLVPGTGNQDNVPALLTPGEAVVPKRLVPSVAPFLSANRVPGFAAGGLVGSGWNFTDVFHPSLGAFGKMISAFASAVTAAVVRSGNQLVNRTLATGAAGLPGVATHGSLPYLERLWDAAGGPPGIAHLMAAIAMAESGGNPNAYNPSGASGLWQILGLPFPGNPFNPLTNAAMAVAKYRSQGLGAWVTYTSGAYRAFYDNGGFLRPGWNLAYNGTGRPERVLSPRESHTMTVIVKVDPAVAASTPDRRLGQHIAQHVTAAIKGGMALYPSGVTPR
jgi:hypothetical protein